MRRNCPVTQTSLRLLVPCTHAGIIREVETNGDRLTELLKKGNIDVCYLNRALKIAVRNDNHVNVGKLVVKGSTNILECLQYAKDAKKPNARAMLLLIKAAQTGDIAIIKKVFSEDAPGLKNPQEYEDDGFRQVQDAALSGYISYTYYCSVAVLMEIAHLNQHHNVREELLFRKDVNEEAGYVHWDGLQLLQLDIPLLRKITWVNELRLARNGLKSLPSEIGTYLKQVKVHTL